MLHPFALLLTTSFSPLHAPWPSQPSPAHTDGIVGYYRMPAIHGDTIVFVSEGDLWRVSRHGGLAQRLTTHLDFESDPAISPSGDLLAFTAAYEGSREVYLMPLGGGAPTRLTYEGENAQVLGWTPGGKVLYATRKFSTLPNYQVCEIDPATRSRRWIPLAQCHSCAYSDDESHLFFTRFSFQGSFTKRYRGGTAQNLWRWDRGASEAVPLTTDFPGTSRSPMWWNGRVYFESDRDGVMNIWSMNRDGKDLRQHTFHADFDVQSPKLHDGRIVYQWGADLRLLDIRTNVSSVLPIRLASDFDQTRERWVTAPVAWMTSAHISPDGKRVAMTARGEVFVAPVGQGRMVRATRRKSVRYRDARFLPDGASLLALSDESGEVELWRLDAWGSADAPTEQLTKDGTILRWTSLPSPNGKWIAHTDKNHRLFVFDTASKVNRLVAESDVEDITDLAWSPDGRYLAFVQAPENTFSQIKIFDTETDKAFVATSDRYNDVSPSFSSDGKFLYFLSDRRLSSVVGSPWGPRAPEPYFDKSWQVYLLPLQKEARSPFQPDDELQKPPPPGTPLSEPLPIDFDGLVERIEQAPIPAGNYRSLTVCGDRLFFLSSPSLAPESPALVSVAIRNKDVKVETILAGVTNFESTPDGKKILARIAGELLVFDAKGAPPNPSEAKVDLTGWSFSFDPKEEWRQMFDEAWRLHRDYFYAPNMHGLDWPAMKRKYRPLVDRVTDRLELSDLLAQMVSELSVLHTYVSGGDRRTGTDAIQVASLGASWQRDESAGGYRLSRIYRVDPDRPEKTGPLLKPGVACSEGDVVVQIDGVPTLSVPDAASLLRAKVGLQVRLRIHPGGDATKARDVIVVPVSAAAERDLRYSDWEYSRRLLAEKASDGKIGYVHLRAMGSADIEQWAREFYPVFDRQALIVDVRHNGGGNIDSWVLERLMRRAWMYWNQHKGINTWNMQYAFRGPMVVLCDEFTASDGEAFTEGFRRLGLGKIIGTRTWGGEVWLTSSNVLVDRGIATAAEFGVFGPEGEWLIEGHGVEPDMVVDNLPHATFLGKDAQLEAGIRHLLAELAKRPVTVPKTPPFPVKPPPRKRNPPPTVPTRDTHTPPLGVATCGKPRALSVGYPGPPTP